jgi:hypothetical protein
MAVNIAAQRMCMLGVSKPQLTFAQAGTRGSLQGKHWQQNSFCSQSTMQLRQPTNTAVAAAYTNDDM